jgi:NTE family protein
MKTKKTIGLALGSGGAKGYAHIGVLKALEKEGIEIDYIAGSSAGALVGAFYSMYRDARKVEKILSDFNNIKTSLLDFSFNGGIIKGNKIFNFLEEELGKRHFKDLQIPFCAIATDYRTCEEVRIKHGDVAFGVRASISIPFVFDLVKCKKRELCDGGLASPVPIQAVKDMGADVVIAVRVEDKLEEREKHDPYSMTVRSMAIMQHNLSEYELAKSDILIDPYFEGFGLLGIQKVSKGKHLEIIEKGQKEMKKKMPLLNSILGKDVSGIYKL